MNANEKPFFAIAWLQLILVLTMVFPNNTQERESPHLVI
jgi:hypothetical protein